jgi:hypothetical protein
MTAAGRGGGWALWRVALLLGMGALAAVYAAVALRYFAFPYGDLGWAIDHLVWNAWQMARGEAVYTDPRLGHPGAFMYTPGFTLMLVPLVKLFGPELWTARLLNLLATGLLLAIVVRETARRVGHRRLGWFAAGLVFLLGGSNFSSLIVVHPEGWAVAFALLALRATQRVSQPAGGRDLAAAVLWSCAAVATKQTMLTYVAVAAVALVAGGRARAAAAYLGVVAALLAAGVALGQWATDGWLLQYLLLGAHHTMQWEQLPAVLEFMAQQLLPYLLVIAAGIAAGAWWRDEAAPVGRLRALLADPWLVALGVGLALQPIVMLKRGNMPNHLLGLSLLLVPLVLQAVEALLPRLRPRLQGRRALAATLGALCLGWTGWRLVQDVPPLWRNLEHYDERVQVAQRLEQIVQQSPGPVWTPMGIAFAYRNGAPVVAPVLIVSEFLAVMPEVIAPVLAQLDRAEFATILVPALFFELLPESEFRPRFTAHYRIAEVVGADAMMGTFTPVVVLERAE